MRNVSERSPVRGTGVKRLPLAGVRVLDFCWVMAGPIMTAMLADLGAEVIKVESNARMDGTRLGRPMLGKSVAEGDRGEWPELQPLYHLLNRNKLGITLNLDEPEGLELAKRLVSESDVVTENFSAGTLNRVGLGYDVLKELNPAIVVLSLSGVGQEGPMKDALTYAPLAVALSGIGRLLNYPGEQSVSRMNAFFGDTQAGFFGAIAVMGTLFRARATGQGEYIDLSQWEAATCGTDSLYLQWQVEGQRPEPTGNRHPWKAPHGIYPAAGEDSWIAIACGSDQQWQSLCAVLGLADLALDRSLTGGMQRLAQSDRIDERIRTESSKHDKNQLAEELQRAGVPAAPVMNIQDQYESEHFRARGIHIEASHEKVGFEQLHGLPWRTARSGRGEFRRGAPLVAQDNDYVFGEILGLTEQQTTDLKERRVIY
jgi:benzylsuccinate CoA-transferase BbsF subunit